MNIQQIDLLAGIKCRAWDGKKMFDCEYIDKFGCGYENYRDLEDRMYSKIIMRYTGLKDKNGKEIYEGDIISQEVSNTLATKGKYETYIHLSRVVFDSGGFCKYTLTPRGSHSIGTLLSFGYTQENTDYLSKEEVIGNIYDNPELLKNN